MHSVNPYFAEFLGTALIIIFGCGATANNNLSLSYGGKMGFFAVSIAWSVGIALPVLIFISDSGSCFNPAVVVGLTIASARQDGFDPARVFGFIGCELLGAMFGAVLVWLFYKDQFDVTEEKEAILGVFCTAPGVWHPAFNFLSETIATCVFVFSLVGFDHSIGANPAFESIRALLVGLVILGIALALGGTTGWAVNPARDLGPRIVHWLMPIQGKGESDWRYAWVPICGPLLGGALGGAFGGLVFGKYFEVK